MDRIGSSVLVERSSLACLPARPWCFELRVKVPSPSPATNRDNEKQQLGWSNVFGSGRDLNQILGILSNYSSFPEYLKKYVTEHVIINDTSPFRFATQKSNSYFSPSTLLDILQDILQYLNLFININFY